MEVVGAYCVVGIKCVVGLEFLRLAADVVRAVCRTECYLVVDVIANVIAGAGWGSEGRVIFHGRTVHAQRAQFPHSPGEHGCPFAPFQERREDIAKSITKYCVRLVVF